MIILTRGLVLLAVTRAPTGVESDSTNIDSPLPHGMTCSLGYQVIWKVDVMSDCRPDLYQGAFQASYCIHPFNSTSFRSLSRVPAVIWFCVLPSGIKSFAVLLWRHAICTC